MIQIEQYYANTKMYTETVALSTVKYPFNTFTYYFTYPSCAFKSSFYISNLIFSLPLCYM